MKKSYIKLLSGLFLFGSNGVVASYITLNSYEIVFLRTLISSIFLFFIFLLSKNKSRALENKKEFIYLVTSGISTGICWMFLYQAYIEIGVSLSTITYYCGPIIVVMLSPIIFKEPLNIYKFTGFIVVLVGMFLANGKNSSTSIFSFGLICGILAAIFYSFMIIFAKKVTLITGIEYTLIQLVSSFLIVAIFLGIKQGFYIENFTLNIFPVLFLGIVNTAIGCYLYFSSIQCLSACSVAICSYIEPLSALLFSAVFLGERLSFVQTIGAFCIIGGAAFAELYKFININSYEIENICKTSLNKSINN